MTTTQTPASQIELSIVLPCLNEIRTLGDCIKSIQTVIASCELSAEVIVADNCSSDGSGDLARELGARVVIAETPGYGSALLAGFTASKGKYIFFADADGSYDFTAIPEFLAELRAGHDLVIGNRFKGGIQPGAMPFLHRYVGNPLLSFIARSFFNSRLGDFHCGMRAFNCTIIEKLNLQSPGMEFATEMIAKAELHGLNIKELPIILAPDGRDRPPHLNTWRDGWRHLKFMLQYTPRWLFLYPGCLLFTFGWLSIGLLYFFRPLSILGVNFDIHTLVYCHVAVVIGMQSILYYLLCKAVAIKSGYIPFDSALQFLQRYLSSDRGVLIGISCSVIGAIDLLRAVLLWSDTSFGTLVPRESMRLVVLGSTLLIMGVELIFFFFFSGLLELQQNDKSARMP